MYKQALLDAQSKKRQKEIREVERRAKIIKKGGQMRMLDDYPFVESYITSKFPQVDLSDLEFYVAGEDVFKKAKWSSLGGCFIPHMNIMLVKDRSLGEKPSKPRGKYQRKLAEYEAMIDPEDVIVHESIHAVSHKAQRSTRGFRHMEEDFVYTNCVDFYHNKGMTNDDIIEKVFLPFCMVDVLENRKDMISIFQKLFDSGVARVEINDMTGHERKKFFNDNADFLVEEIVKIAREKGKRMITCYNEYGRGMSLVSMTSGVDKSLRFASIRYDGDL